MDPEFSAALEVGATAVVRVYLSLGVSSEEADANGMTPLMLASRGGHIETCIELIRQGALAETVDPQGRNASEFARLGGYDDIALWLGRCSVNARPVTSRAGSTTRVASSKARELHAASVLSATLPSAPAQSIELASVKPIQTPISPPSKRRLVPSGDEIADKPQSQLQRLLERGKAQGHLTYTDVNDLLAGEIVDVQQIEDTVVMFNEMGIPVYESAEEAESKSGPHGPNDVVVGFVDRKSTETMMTGHDRKLMIADAAGWEVDHQHGVIQESDEVEPPPVDAAKRFAEIRDLHVRIINANGYASRKAREFAKLRRWLQVQFMELEFAPQMLDALVENLRTHVRTIRKLEREILLICVHEAGMPREEFISSFKGHEANLNWIDRQVVLGRDFSGKLASFRSEIVMRQRMIGELETSLHLTVAEMKQISRDLLCGEAKARRTEDSAATSKIALNVDRSVSRISIPCLS